MSALPCRGVSRKGVRAQAGDLGSQLSSRDRPGEPFPECGHVVRFPSRPQAPMKTEDLYITLVIGNGATKCRKILAPQHILLARGMISNRGSAGHQKNCAVFRRHVVPGRVGHQCSRRRCREGFVTHVELASSPSCFESSDITVGIDRSGIQALDHNTEH